MNVIVFIVSVGILLVNAHGLDHPQSRNQERIRRFNIPSKSQEEDSLTVEDFKALEKKFENKKDHRFNSPKYLTEFQRKMQLVTRYRKDLQEIQVGCEKGFTADRNAKSHSNSKEDHIKQRNRRSSPYDLEFPPAFSLTPKRYYNPGSIPDNPIPRKSNPWPYHFEYPQYVPRSSAGLFPQPDDDLVVLLQEIKNARKQFAETKDSDKETGMRSHEDAENFDELSKFPTYNAPSPAGFIPKPNDDLIQLSPVGKLGDEKDLAENIDRPEEDLKKIANDDPTAINERPVKRSSEKFDSDGITKDKPLDVIAPLPFGIIPNADDVIDPNLSIVRPKQTSERIEKRLATDEVDPDGITKDKPLDINVPHPFGIVPSPDDDIDKLFDDAAKAARNSRSGAEGLFEKHTARNGKPFEISKDQVNLGRKTGPQDDGITKTEPLEVVQPLPFGLIPKPEDEIEHISETEISNTRKKHLPNPPRQEVTSANNKDLLAEFPRAPPLPYSEDSKRRQKQSTSDYDPLSKFPNSKQPIPYGIIPNPDDDLDALIPKREAGTSAESISPSRTAENIPPNASEDDPLSKFPSYIPPSPSGVIPNPDDDLEKLQSEIHYSHNAETHKKPTRSEDFDPLSKFPTYNPPIPAGYIPKPDEDLETLANRPKPSSIPNKSDDSETFDPLSKFPTYNPPSPVGHIPRPEDDLDKLSPKLGVPRQPPHIPIPLPPATVEPDYDPFVPPSTPSPGLDFSKFLPPFPQFLPPFDNRAFQSSIPDLHTTEDPGRCIWAMVTCCSHKNTNLQDSCFEQMGCKGPFTGGRACSSENARNTMGRAQQFYGDK